MIRESLAPAMIGLGIVLASLAPAARAADCRPSLNAEARAAVASGGLARMQSLYRDAELCDAELGEWLGERIAAALFNRAVAGAALDPALLNQSVTYARLWQALEALGDIADEHKDYDQALGFYQEALAQMQNTAATPVEPPLAKIVKLHAKADRANLLTASYQPMRTGRDGKTTGIGAYSIRSVVFARQPLPIQFEFGTTQFTPKGAAAAADLVSLFQREPPSGRVIIEGHTDERGSDDYNMTLSQRRAEAVVAFLRERLTDASVEFVPVGRGKAVPFDAAQAEGLTDDERRQLDRRVEIVR